VYRYLSKNGSRRLERAAKRSEFHELRKTFVGAVEFVEGAKPRNANTIMVENAVAGSHGRELVRILKAMLAASASSIRKLSCDTKLNRSS
jgi:hypothetical protein